MKKYTYVRSGRGTFEAENDEEADKIGAGLSDGQLDWEEYTEKVEE